MKSKQNTFKNPFDLMQEQQEQIIELKPKNQKNFIQGKGKVHTPLPFDPYNGVNDSNQFQTTSSNKNIKYNQPTSSYSNIVKQNKKNTTNKTKNGFVNPFGGVEFEEEHQVISPVQKGPVGFNPAQTISKTYVDPNSKSQSFQQQQRQYLPNQLNEDGDPPLLQDIGINIQNIKQRIMMTIKIQKPQPQHLMNADLSGPIMIALIFGFLLLLSGKIHFGDIYAMFLFGNTIMYFLINFMNQSQIIPLYNVMSSLGYSLLPMLILGFFNIFISLKGTLGILISLSIAVWASLGAGNTMDVYLKSNNNERKVLLVYPLFLFYLCFAMIVIF